MPNSRCEQYASEDGQAPQKRTIDSSNGRNGIRPLPASASWLVCAALAIVGGPFTPRSVHKTRHEASRVESA